MEGNKPVKKFTYGTISVAVWQNDGKTSDGRAYSFMTASAPTRNYKDKAGAWQNTSSLRKNDIDNAIRCLQEAAKYLNDNTKIETETQQ